MLGTVVETLSDIFHLFLTVFLLLENEGKREFPGSPGVRTRCFHRRGARVQSLVGELSFCKPHGVAKKKKKKRGQSSTERVINNYLWSDTWQGAEFEPINLNPGTPKPVDWAVSLCVCTRKANRLVNTSTLECGGTS